MSQFNLKMSEEINSIINERYLLGGLNVTDLSNTLINNKIDNLNTPHNHIGFDRSYDDSLTVLYYEDGSALVCGPYNVSAVYQHN